MPTNYQRRSRPNSENSAARYIPDRNDIVWLDFEPTKGKEIGKYRSDRQSKHCGPSAEYRNSRSSINRGFHGS